MTKHIHIVLSDDWNGRAVAAFGGMGGARELAARLHPMRVDEEFDDWFDRVSRYIESVPLLEVVEDAE